MLSTSGGGAPRCSCAYHEGCRLRHGPRVNERPPSQGAGCAGKVSVSTGAVHGAPVGSSQPLAVPWLTCSSLRNCMLRVLGLLPCCRECKQALSVPDRLMECPPVCSLPGGWVWCRDCKQAIEVLLACTAQQHAAYSNQELMCCAGIASRPSRCCWRAQRSRMRRNGVPANML